MVEFYRKYEDRFPEDQKKKALAAIGRYASGVSDISEKHDDYLSKAFKAEESNDKMGKVFGFDKHFAEHGFEVLNEFALRWSADS